ncbi:TPA: 50S ribosomal protein L1 [Candidatus Geothermarchaeota archaeon]|nr:50S ribosomal protein L1 [Candidatus Geothermarchaeota archaeon]HIQ13076.1 50S ribosomal protein L1 [Thermoprotei archaeon]
MSMKLLRQISVEDIKKGIEEALNKSKKRNFRQSVDLILSIDGLDLKRPENRVRLVIRLPYGPSKERSVAVFADGVMAERSREAGADKVITEKELMNLLGQKREIKKLANKYNFFAAEPKMMAHVGRVMGFALGPRGKIPQIIPPNADINKVLSDLKRSVLINIRNNPMASVSIGHEDMSIDELAANAKAVIEALSNKLPEKSYIKNIYVKTTMGPSIRIL